MPAHRHRITATTSERALSSVSGPRLCVGETKSGVEVIANHCDPQGSQIIRVGTIWADNVRVYSVLITCENIDEMILIELQSLKSQF